MREDNTGNRRGIAYFIDFSIQEIPSIVYIAYETGGTIYTDSQQTYRFLTEQHPKLSAALGETIAAIKSEMIRNRVRVIVYPDYHIRYFRDLPGVKHVQVFHGTSDKKYDYSKEVSGYDLFFISGKAAYERYEKRGLLKNNKGMLIGYPKLDRVFRGEIDRDAELIKIGMDPSRKTVLYAPTWVDRAYNSSWKKFRQAIAGDTPEDLNLIVKLHPNIKRYRPGEVEEFAKVLSRNKSARLFEVDPDPVPRMAASDLLMGDVSAVTREFLAFRRPFLFLSSKPAWLWSRQKTALWECGEVVNDPEKLWEAVRRGLADPGRFAPAISRHLDRTFFKPDGKAAARAKEAIYRLCSE
jgi:hypothetical protein